MPLKLITAPASEPITTAEAKTALRIDTSDQDTLIAAFITAAREQCEQHTGRALLTQTWERTLDAFPDNEIRLGWPPIIAITSVKYIDVDGVEQTLAANVYTLDNDTEPGWLLLADGQSWPATSDVANAVRVRFTAGYASAAAVPQSLKTWITLKVGELIENREASSAKPAQAHPFVSGLLDRYTVVAV